MNKAILIGNLSRDPELSTTPNTGNAVCKFGLAVNRRFANADGNRECDFFNIVAWRQLGENCAKFLKKGSKVGVTGRIEIRSYDAQDGSKRQVTEIIADEVEFLSKVENAQSGANDGVTEQSASNNSAMTPISDDNLPF